MKTENTNNKPSPGKKNGINWLCVLCAVGYPFMPAFVLSVIFYLLYLGTESVVCLILLILTVLGYLGFVLYLLVYFSKPGTPSAPANTSDGHSDLTSDEATAFSAGLLGGALLSRTLRKHTHSDDKNVNDFLWQEKTRRDMNDDGFVDW